MDQSPHKIAHVITDKNGEKVIVDPEASINSVMLWFYLLINIGACFGIPTTYLAKIVSIFNAFLLYPGVITAFFGDAFLLTYSRDMSRMPHFHSRNLKMRPF